MSHATRPTPRPFRLAITLLFAGMATGCGGTPANPGPAPEAETLPIPALLLPEVETEAEDPPAGPPLLPVALSEDPSAAREAGAVDAGPPIAPTPLSLERTRALLGRLPAPEPAGEDAEQHDGTRNAAVEDAAGAGSSPTVDVSHADRPATDPLVRTVVPEGPTDIAPHVTIVFREPMVAPAAAGAPTAAAPPAHLEPSPPGTWRWLDARTLRFRPEAGRLPGGTSFTVTIPSGTRTLAGHTSGDEFRTSFRTEGPRAVGGRPADEPSELRPILLLAFDQRVDPDAVLAAAHLLSPAGPHELTHVSTAELSAQPRYAAAAEEAGEGRWVALQPVEALPAGAEARLVLAAGLRSEEGPLPQARPQELRFRTRHRLRVEETSCGTPEEPCEAFGGWTIRFSNPLDAEATEAATEEEGLRIEPAVRGFRPFIFRDELRLQGVFEPFTTYRLELPAGVTDDFGQRLGRTEAMEIHVGPAAPFVRLPGAPFLALDPAAPARIEVPSRGANTLEIELYRVGIEHWPAFAGVMALQTGNRGPPLPDRMPGERVLHDRITPRAGLDAEQGWYARTPVDLTPALADGLGHAILVVRSVTSDGEPIGEEAAWIQVSGLGLTAASDHTTLVGRAWATGDGASLEGVRVELPGSGVAATTDAAGFVRLPLSTGDSLLVARRGPDTAILPPDPRPRSWSGWARDERQPLPLWYAVTDRGLYRPGEEMWVHGWMRLPATRAGEVALRPPEGVDSLLLSLQSSRGEALGERSAHIDPDGRFHGRFLLPEDARTGRARVGIAPIEGGEAEDSRGTRAFLEIAEFRRPEYEVLLEADPSPHVAGSRFRAWVEARYFDGPALSGAPVHWRARTSLASWQPPGWSGWHVGPDFRTRMELRTELGESTLHGRTGADGVHTLRAETGEPRHPFPVQLELEAEVRDLDRQVDVASTRRVIHPASLVAALRPDRRWLAPGEELEVLVAVADLDGRAVDVSVPELRTEVWAEPLAEEGEPLEPLSCERDRRRIDGREAVEVAACTFRPREPGPHRLVAEVVDASGARSRSEVEIHVTGPRIGILSQAPFSSGGLEIRPDRDSYAPGDTAQVLVETPIQDARGLAVLQRFGIRQSIPFEIRDGAALVPVPLPAGEAGTFRLGVEVSAGSGAPTVRRRTELLEVSAEEHRLAVDVRAEPGTVEPGDSLTVEIGATDADGRPAAGATVTLWAVDEAVLGLADYTLPDPIAGFFRWSGYSAHWTSLHEHLERPRRPVPHTITARLLDARSGEVLGRALVRIPELELEATSDPDGEVRVEDVPAGTYTLEVFVRGEPMLERRVDVGEEGLDLGVLLVAPLGAGEVHLDSLRAGVSFNSSFAALGEASMAAAGVARSERGLGFAIAADDLPTVRRDFAPLAAFVSGVELDAEGRAEARIRLPDTMTRYRIFALVSRGTDQFGRGEGTVTARRDLVVRATPPRFLHPGDQADVPVTVQNASEQAVDVEVAARTGGLALEEPAGWHLALAAGERGEVRVPVRAGGTGQGEVEVVAASTARDNGGGAGGADALAVSVPVRAPEGSLRVGALHARLVGSDAISLPIDLPSGTGGELEILASSSLLHGISDALLVLCREPLPWPEITAPRLLALAGGLEVVEALQPPGVPTPDELRRQIAVDVEILLRTLVSDRELDPFTTIQAIHALHLAQSAGVAVTPFELARAGRDLEEHLQELGDELPRPGDPAAARLAYALHVAAALELGEEDVAGEVARRWVRALLLDDLSAEALAWLLRPLAGEDEESEILRILANRAIRSTSGATLRQGEVTDAGWTASYRTTDAIVLAALLERAPDADDPAPDLADELLRSLLAHRDGGSWWASAYESAWGVLALGRAFAREGAAGPPDLVVTGRLGDDPIGQTRLGEGHDGALRWRVPVGGPTELHLRSEGEGTVHLRVELRYTEPALDPDPVDRGFSVTRSYEPVDDPGDVVRETDGSWRIRAGARVRVRLSLTTPVRRHRVELRDPLPGGFEAIERGTTRDPDGAPDARMAVPAPVPTGDRLPWFLAPTEDWTERVFRLRIAAGLPWHTHREVADGRIDAYTAFLPAGSFETTHLVRAAVPGSYHVAPPRAEEVSHAETSGTGSPDRVVIEGESLLRAGARPHPTGRSVPLRGRALRRAAGGRSMVRHRLGMECGDLPGEPIDVVLSGDLPCGTAHRLATFPVRKDGSDPVGPLRPVGPGLVPRDSVLDEIVDSARADRYDR